MSSIPAASCLCPSARLPAGLSALLLMRLRLRMLVAIWLLGLSLYPVASTYAALPGEPWAAAFQDFDSADAVNPSQPGAVVFVGSSSIRLWAGLERQFAGWPRVIKRGFGGSQLTDHVRHAQRLVSVYQPSLVLLYAGENDLAAGRSPAQVLQSFEAFVGKVREHQPDLPVAFISIKPSPSRRHLMADVREANQLIKAHAARLQHVYFVDVFTPMLDADGQPRAELFAPDALHLSPSGYALWQAIISTSLPAALMGSPQ